MTFEELIEQVQKLECQEKRAFEKDYCEVVVTKAKLAPINTLLKSYFGSPLKPEGQEASAEAARYAQPHGGIYGNQTLYFHKSEKTSELAFLWPWGNGTSVTLKIIRE